MQRLSICFGIAALCVAGGSTPGAAGQPVSDPSGAAAPVLGIDGTAFTLNGKKTFLLGASYYGALGAPDDFIARDLDDLRTLGFNWIRNLLHRPAQHQAGRRRGLVLPQRETEPSGAFPGRQAPLVRPAAFPGTADGSA